MMFATSALAQESDDDEVLEEVIVHGIRYSQAQAVGIKRNAIGVVDAISADDIGRLPDKNAAEAVDRLPGVSISTDQGEGRFVVIRGVSPNLNNLTINGQSAGSPDEGGGRASPLDVVGGDLLKSIEVIKTPTPDMDGQGIGGTVNVVTPSPFDREESIFGAVSVRAGYEDFSDNVPYAGNFSLGGQNSTKTIGYYLSGSYSYRDFVSRGVFQDDWRDINGESTDMSTTSEFVPENAKNTLYNLERTRTAFNASLELQPDENNHYYIRGYYSQFDEDEQRQRYEHFFSRSPFALNGLTGSSDSNRREQDLRLEQKDKRFANISAGAEHMTSENWTVAYGLQYNSNQQDEPNRNWEFRGNGYGPDTWNITDRGVVQITPGAQDVQDPSLLNFRRIRNQDNNTEEKSLITHLDFERITDFGSRPGYIKFGVKYSDTERDNDGSRARYDAGDVGFSMAEFGHAGSPFINEVDGNLLPHILIDPTASNQFFDQNFNNTDFFDLNTGSTFADQFDSDYLINEDVLAAYAMANIDLTDTANIVFGVRAERTRVDSTGFRRNEDTQTAQRLTEKSDYTNVLPSIVYRWNATDNLVVRAAWTNAIGRPGFNQIANISEFFAEDVLGDFIGSISVGNPSLEPHESTNFDLSLEYYLGQTGILSGAVFYKDIDNFIFGFTNQCDTISGGDTSCEFEGVSYDVFTFSSVENAESAKISGVEVNYQQGLDFLPAPFSGLGIGISAALIESEFQIRGRDFEQTLLEQPDWTTSFMVYYQTERFEATLAIDDSSEYLDDVVGDDGTEDIFKEGYGRLDFKASYQFGDSLTAFLEWQNINDEPLEEFQGGVRRWNTQIETYGQTIMVGLSTQF